MFKFKAEGITAKNRNRVFNQTNFSLLKPNLSIIEDTGRHKIKKINIYKSTKSTDPP